MRGSIMTRISGLRSLTNYTSKEFVFSPLAIPYSNRINRKQEKERTRAYRGASFRGLSHLPLFLHELQSHKTHLPHPDSKWDKARVLTVLPLEDFTTLEMEHFTGVSPLCRPLYGSLYGVSLVPTLCIEGTYKGMEGGEDNGSTKEL